MGMAHGSKTCRAQLRQPACNSWIDFLSFPQLNRHCRAVYSLEGSSRGDSGQVIGRACEVGSRDAQNSSTCNWLRGCSISYPSMDESGLRRGAKRAGDSK